MHISVPWSDIQFHVERALTEDRAIVVIAVAAAAAVRAQAGRPPPRKRIKRTTPALEGRVLRLPS